VVSTDAEPEQLQRERWPEESKTLLPDREKCRVKRTLNDLDAAIEAHNKQLVEANQPKAEMDEVIAAQLYTGPVSAPLLLALYIVALPCALIGTIPVVAQMFEKYNAVSLLQQQHCPTHLHTSTH
jgi:hypothetical protein